MNLNKVLGLIPARFGSTRFPGKPLAMIDDKPMIQWVYEQASKALPNVYVATDDERIYKAVVNFGGKVVMTGENHQSGTDRCKEALLKVQEQVKTKFDIVINIQGDEPFISPDQIKKVAHCFNSPKAQLATLIKKATCTEDIFDINKPKVVVNNKKEAIYFSRSPIPFVRGVEKDEWINKESFFNHVGIYGYRAEALLEITELAPSKLELAESLEQLRWIENGYIIATEITDFESFGVDTPEDLDKLIKQRNL